MTLSILRRNSGMPRTYGTNVPRSNGPLTSANSAATPLSRVFEEFFTDPFFTETPAFAPALALLRPGANAPEMPIDIVEDDKSVTIHASLPGFTKEQVSVELEGGLLTIKAVSESETVSQSPEHAEPGQHPGASSGPRFVRRERRTGSVGRSIAMPEGLLEEQITADLKDGVLTIKLPKAEPRVSRKVTIN